MTTESSGLRNVFSTASIGGALDRGVLRSDTFRLKGPMVDMSGGGWLDLNAKTCDFGISVTFAKVPTVPVRFYGSLSTPHMQVRGVDMVVETMQHAGLTVFGLVRGVLMLPAHALQGIGALFENGGAETKAPARTAPVKDQTGHPGQGTGKKP
jgi:AsmA protein